MKKALLFSLTINVIGALALTTFIVKRYYYSTRHATASAPDWSEDWNKVKNDLYTSAPVSQGDIVFVGDSHIERFLVNDYFPGVRIRNRGIGSNTTKQALKRLPAILQGKPAKVFLLIGINDLSMLKPVDSVFKNIVKIAEATRAAGSTLYLISLFPSRGKDADLNYVTIKINNRIKEYCKMSGAIYIDVFHELVSGGELNKELTSDNTHLNGKGYEIFRRTVEKYVK